jgi:hypothetical protein
MQNDRTVLRRGVGYVLGDVMTDAECQRYDLERTRIGNPSGVVAVWDGSPRRPPKKGEWYFSGAEIHAYRAPNDLLTPYHIAQFASVETQTTHKLTVLEEKGG